MKTKYLRTALLIMTVAAVAVSCAKKEEVGFEELEQRSLDAWMKLNAPDATRWDNGMYVETLAEGTGPAVSEGDWVRINFTGTDLHGTIFVTRDQETAELLGTKRTRTRYEPLYTLLDRGNYTMTPAQIEVLLSGMKEGDSLRVYFPSHLGYGSYGSSYSYGYEGQTALGANVPAIISMKLVEIVPDPNLREKVMVQDHADVLGIDTPLVDREGSYNDMRRDSLLYCKVSTPNLLPADTIRKDSVVNIYYIGKFLDGFIFDTNIDSVAQRAFEDFTEHDPIIYTPSSSRDSYIQAFYEVFDVEIPAVGSGEPAYIRYGDWVTMVFTSALGYGSNGSYPSSSTEAKTIIQPYTPLVFEFFTESTREDDDEEE